MKLKPHEILQKLGFNIGEEGIELDDKEAFLHLKSLELIGETISVANIPEKDVLDLYDELTDSNGNKPAPSLERFTAIIRLNLLFLYRYVGPSTFANNKCEYCKQDLDNYRGKPPGYVGPLCPVCFSVLNKNESAKYDEP